MQQNQRRQSGLKSEGAWMRVNIFLIFPVKFPRNFDFSGNLKKIDFYIICKCTSCPKSGGRDPQMPQDWRPYAKPLSDPILHVHILKI